MRPMILFAALSFMLLLASDPSGAAWNGRPFSAQVVTSNAQAGGQDMTGRIFVDRPGMRMEQTALGQQTIVLVRFGERSTTVLMPAEKTYMEMPQSGGAGAMAAQMGDGPCGGYQRSTKLGREILQGRKVEKIRCQAPKIPYLPATTTIWYDHNLDFVILQETGPGDRFELRNIEEGAQPAALFEIPQGYSKMVMPTMPGAEGVPSVFAIDPSQMEGLSDAEKALIRKRMEKMMKQMQQPE